MGGVLCGANSHRVVQALDGLGGFPKGLADANKAKFAEHFKVVTVQEGTPLYKVRNCVHGGLIGQSGSKRGICIHLTLLAAGCRKGNLPRKRMWS